MYSTDQVRNNREKLKKQDAWAQSVAKKEFMKNVVVEERRYGPEERERLDLIYPKKRGTGRMPVLFYIHGGGWIAGRKEARRIYCGKFAESGYFVVNIEYTLAPEAKFPTAVRECVNAADYILDHAEEYGIDPDRIAVGGESAGGYYAAFLTAIAKNKNILQEIGLEPMRHTEFDVKACMLNCAAVSFREMIRSGFPDAGLMVWAYTGFTPDEITRRESEEALVKIELITYMDQNFPPTLLIYGSLDSLRTNTFLLDQKMTELGIPHRLYKSTGIFYGQHTTTMILKSRRAFQVYDDVDGFLKEHLQVGAL